MPTYDYVCQNCGHRFEHFQSMSARTLKKCPECGKPKLVRLIGAGAAVIFKGSGFYQTDYRTDNYNKGSKAETTPASAPAAKKDDGKKESTPSPKDSSTKEPPKPETPKSDSPKKDSGKKDTGKKD
jgi:putative FmdB family regulatory protein